MIVTVGETGAYSRFQSGDVRSGTRLEPGQGAKGKSIPSGEPAREAVSGQSRKALLRP